MTYVDRVAAPFAFVVTEDPNDEVSVVRQAQARDMQAFERLYQPSLLQSHFLSVYNF